MNSTRSAALLAAAAMAATVGACAPSLQPAPASPPSPTSPPAVSVPAAEPEAEPEPPRVQVRHFSFSPEVAVLAWGAADAAYGLRASLDRSGALVRDHRLYVSAYYEPALAAFPRAKLASRPLMVNGIRSDPWACHFGDCSPPRAFEARIPDDLLRSHRDSAVIRFHADDGRELILRVAPEVVDAYLAAVDSVSARLRRS
jgi:hypothetical protein